MNHMNHQQQQHRPLPHHHPPVDVDETEVEETATIRINDVLCGRGKVDHGTCDWR